MKSLQLTLQTVTGYKYLKVKVFLKKVGIKSLWRCHVGFYRFSQENVQAQIYFFPIWLSIFFKEGKLFIAQRKCKGREKRDRLLVYKMEFNFQFFQQNKKFTY